jgi:hypothetical protein
VTTVNESWYSKQLNRAVLSKRVDPRFGEQTTRLTNIRLSEPDSSLFQIPADYTIEESGVKR